MFHSITRSSLNLSSLALKTTKRSISRHIVVKGLPKFVTKETLEDKFIEFGIIHSVRLHLSPDPKERRPRHINASIQYKTIEAAQAMMDECQQTVMFNERVQMEYHLVPLHFRTNARWFYYAVTNRLGAILNYAKSVPFSVFSISIDSSHWARWKGLLCPLIIDVAIKNSKISCTIHY